MDTRSIGVRVLWFGLLVAYPFHRYLDFGLGRFNASLGDGVIFVVGMLWLLGVVGRRRVPVYLGPLGGFVVVSAVSFGLASASGAPWLDSPAYASEVVRYGGAAAWLVGVFVLARAISTTALRRGLVLSVGVACVLALVAVTESVVGGVLRPSGSFENPNIFANYLVLHLAVLLYLGPVDHGGWQATIVAGVASLVLAFGVVITGSRGGLIALATLLVFVGAIAVHRRSVRPGHLLAVGGVSAAALVAIWQHNPWLFTNRLLSDRNIDIRLQMWEHGLDAFVASPVFGIGLGQLRHYLDHTIGVERSVHNSVVSIGAEAGLVGFVLMLVVLWLVVRDVVAAEDRRLVFLLGFLVATIAQGTVATNVETFRSIWLVMGLIAAVAADSISAASLRQSVGSVFARANQ